MWIFDVIGMDVVGYIEENEGVVALSVVGWMVTVMDLYLSFVLTQMGFIEANPVMHHISTEYGLWTFVLINLVLSVIVLVLLTWGSLEKVEGRWKYLPLLIYCVVRGAAVVNNVWLFLMG